MNSRHPLLIAFLTAFGVVGAVLLALLIALQCAPFGQNSLAQTDANIQYIYYLQYLRNGLLGHDSIAYTFTNQLGSSGVGIYTYYLLDPTNLLVAFVDPAEIYAFYDLVSVLRVALAAGFCAMFLSWRFGRPLFLTLALSAAYALSQASLLTMDNFMWLDGILMLPLLLMATSYLVRRGRGWVLAVTLAATIVLNWYTGFIDLIVTIPWLIYELLDRERMPGDSSAPRLMVAYGVAVVLGLPVSACVLVPTVLQMRNTPAAEALGGGLLYPPLFRGRSFAPSLLGSFVFGGLYGGNPGTLELWVGPLVMLGCAGALFLARGRRAAHWFLAICAVAPILIGPLDKILGLLKDVWSSWPRYGYGVVLLLILLAATWLYGWAHGLGDREDGSSQPSRASGSQSSRANAPQSSRAQAPIPSRARVLALVPLALVLCGLLLLGRNGNPTVESWNWAVTIGSLLACCGLMVAASLAHSSGRRRLTSAACGLLTVLVGTLIVANGYLVVRDSLFEWSADEDRYMDYMGESLESMGEGLAQSRVAMPWPSVPGHIMTPNLGFALGVPSVQAYTSSPSARQLTLFQRLGYPPAADTFSVNRTVILPADSLVGVRYVLDDIAEPGLVRISAPIEGGTLALYENPYYLPLGLSYEPTGDAVTDTGSPFLYQQALYDELLGEPSRLYTIVEPAVEEPSTEERVFEVRAPEEGRWVLYAAMDWASDQHVQIEDGSTRGFTLQQWVSPDVVPVPLGGDGVGRLTVRADDWGQCEGWEFALLDLDRLEVVTSSLRDRGAKTLEFANGSVAFEVQASGGEAQAGAGDAQTSAGSEALYTSIPYDQGWTVRRNGEVVEPQLFADCLMVVPLESGANTVEMTYSIPGLLPGMVVAAVGIAGIVGWALIDRRRSAHEIARSRHGR